MNPFNTALWTWIFAHQLGETARGLDLIDDPIPAADRLDRHGRSPLAALEKLAHGAALMLDPFLSHELAVGRGHRGQRVVLVRVERDIFHLLRLLSRLTPPSVSNAHGNLAVRGGAALSFHHLTPTLFWQILGRIERLGWHPT